MEQCSSRPTAICRTFCPSVCQVTSGQNQRRYGFTDFRVSWRPLPAFSGPTMSGDTPRFGDDGGSNKQAGKLSFEAIDFTPQFQRIPGVCCVDSAPIFWARKLWTSHWPESLRALRVTPSSFMRFSFTPRRARTLEMVARETHSAARLTSVKMLPRVQGVAARPAETMVHSLHVSGGPGMAKTD
ncbi:uncharacterized protein LY79DRAFT_159749 [Colletotrichum navitas]|uniref:Uncharacterized protein n=1 Tax=Colletotrichum navitas TaxID=681940 RepID=A0AAD8Q3H1_9PEZI|nr:uncharacterized protein LY79DRAFT_159749 [Colletotrichum navitas]KAK1594119.1 hypothetical protein LY79DRAFT_159749 [Colletotrichum navitas]